MTLYDFFGVEYIEELDLENIMSLVDNKVSESLHLDYKREPWGEHESSNREMARDVSSFANAHGGFIIVGIEEDNDGKPANIVGLDNEDKTILRIRQVCHAGIQPLITGLKIHPVRIDENSCLIVIYIPESFTKPHMVLNEYRCYMRYERGKNPMNIYQIEESIKSREKNREKVRTFLDKRNRELLKLVKNNSAMNISIVPHVLEKERFDIFSRHTEKTLENFVRKNIVRNRFIPTFDGFLSPGDTESHEYVQLLVRANGYIEYFQYLPFRDKLPADWFRDELEKILEITDEFYRALDISFRGWIHVEFYNMINYTLKIEDISEKEKSHLLRNRDGYFELPSVAFEEFSCERARLVKKVNDFLWRKFGITRSNV